MNSSTNIGNNCNRHYALFPSKPVCLGHGICVNNQCICADGWTYRGDFLIDYKEHYDCDHNISMENLRYDNISYIIT